MLFVAVTVVFELLILFMLLMVVLKFNSLDELFILALRERERERERERKREKEIIILIAAKQKVNIIYIYMRI